MNYWEEAFCCALEEAGIPLPSKEQRKLAVDVLEGAFENYGMAHGHECIPNPMIAEKNELEKNLRNKISEAEKQAEIWKYGVARHFRLHPDEMHRLYINNGEIYISRN